MHSNPRLSDTSSARLRAKMPSALQEARTQMFPHLGLNPIHLHPRFRSIGASGKVGGIFYLQSFTSITLKCHGMTHLLLKDLTIVFFLGELLQKDIHLRLCNLYQKNPKSKLLTAMWQALLNAYIYILDLWHFITLRPSPTCNQTAAIAPTGPEKSGSGSSEDCTSCKEVQRRLMIQMFPVKGLQLSQVGTLMCILIPKHSKRMRNSK